jgi:futalosine hydrolase
MNILLLAATAKEMEVIRQELPEFENSLHLDYLVSGVGLTATAYALTKKLQEHDYDFVFNFGIAGSFDEALQIGEVVEVTEEHFADFGAESPEGFLSAFEIGLWQKDQTPFKEAAIKCAYPKMLEGKLEFQKVKGVSVNQVHGETTSIQELKARYGKGVESMEGAACFYVCALEKIPCLQLRAISNKVEPRNRANWEIEKALRNLSLAVNFTLKQLR